MRISLLELSRLGYVANGEADPTRIAPYLRDGLRLSAGGLACDPEGLPLQTHAPEGWTVWEWKVACSASGARVIESTILLAAAPGHVHFARVHSDGAATQERVLSDGERRWSLGGAEGGVSGAKPEGTSIGGYLVLGVEHILSGWDHLAFVLALLLLASTAGEVARLITGFTLAHSVTLALAVLGILNPEPGPVEALIGFSIALVAAENAWLLSGRRRWIPGLSVAGVLAMSALAFAGYGLISGVTLLGVAIFAGCHFGLLEHVRNPQTLRVAVAFAFGLIHGFGFAGVLAEMSLPTDRLVAALFGFNVGVEAGQLAVVLLVWPLLRALARVDDGRAHAWVAEAGSAAICGLGLFWFVTRSFSS
ncbi:MAG: HupE/UreJ family protein [bacterium]|nr:HupE/UreJ family protein [bacterium]